MKISNNLHGYKIIKIDFFHVNEAFKGLKEMYSQFYRYQSLEK